MTTKLQNELGFALKHDERHGWLVIEEGEDDRCATLTEQVLWQALTDPGYLAAPVAPADYPECSGDPNCCPENEGFGCCKAPAEQSHAVSNMEGISDGRAEAAPALVPLTKEQIHEELFYIYSLPVPSTTHAVMLARAVERLHGIKP